MYVCVWVVEYCSAMKRSKTRSSIEIWLDLESVKQREAKKRKIKHHILYMGLPGG